MLNFFLGRSTCKTSKYEDGIMNDDDDFPGYQICNTLQQILETLQDQQEIPESIRTLVISNIQSALDLLRCNER